MSEPNETISQPPIALQRIRNHRLRRGIYLLPTFFTVGNLLCGFFAVLATLLGSVTDLDNAAKAIGLAILFDTLDGRVARATGTNSEFGKQFDSLADVVSFGVAPALLAFAWGVRGLLQSDAIGAHHVYQFGWVVCYTFVICCAWRLARFNVHGMAAGGSRYFVGLPTPPAAGMIAAFVHAFFRSPIYDWRVSLLWLVLVLGVGLLMTSRIRYYSFKDVGWTKRQRSDAMVAMGLLAAAIVFLSQVTLILIACTYVLAGLILHVVRFVRHRLAASHPA